MVGLENQYIRSQISQDVFMVKTSHPQINCNKNTPHPTPTLGFLELLSLACNCHLSRGSRQGQVLPREWEPQSVNYK